MAYLWSTSTNTQHAFGLPQIPRKAIPVGRRCPRLGRLRLWRPWRCRWDFGMYISCGAQMFFFSVFYPDFLKSHLARRSALLSSAQLRSQLLCSGLLCSAAQRSAVRCHALPCDAVLDRAAPCCVHTRYHTKVPGTRVCT